MIQNYQEAIVVAYQQKYKIESKSQPLLLKGVELKGCCLSAKIQN